MKKDFIVHTVAEQDVPVTAEVKGKKQQVKVAGLVAELVSMDDGVAHSHTFTEGLDQARELLVPGQELTLTFARKAGAKTLTPKDADPTKADEYRVEALYERDKTESQREDEEKAEALRKSGKPDPVTQTGSKK